MERTVCFYNETPLTKRDYDRFGFEIFLGRGFRVSFLDMTRLLHPNYLVNYDPPLKNYDGVVIARNEQDVLNFVEQNHKALAIVLLAYNQATRFLYTAFRKYNIQYVQSEPLPIPWYPSPSFELPRLWQQVKTFRYLDATQLISRKLRSMVIRGMRFAVRMKPARLDGVQPPRYILRAARKYLRVSPTPSTKTNILWLHYFDYDLYLKLKERQVSEPRPYHIVFIDEYYPFDPDFFVSGAGPSGIDPEKYYKGLNRFFDFVERRMNMPVVIAANPRARYDQRPDYFRGRRVEQYKTIELVSQSKLVLSHASRAINFAIMFRKPFLVLTCDDLERSEHGPGIVNFATWFGKKPINVDRETERDLDQECSVDERKYREYFIDYIKIPGTPEKPYWDVVADKIEEDYFS